MNKTMAVLLSGVSVFAMSACSHGGSHGDAVGMKGEMAKKDTMAEEKPATNQEVMNGITIETTLGTVILDLELDKTPMTAGNFVNLAAKGFYDGVIFHRVIPGFMAQGGDPTGTGMGGPGYKFGDEIDDSLSNVRGTISMANAGPATNGSQFFLNVNDNVFLDGKHAVFGRIVDGMDIVDAMVAVDRNAMDRPDEDIVMTKVTVSDEYKAWLEENADKVPGNPQM